MTAYRTCRNCAADKAACARRAEISAAIKGLGITSMAFRCDLRRPLYRAGQRVGVTWKYYPPDWSWEEGYSLETWPATVVTESQKGFVIAVDDVPSDNDLPAREYIKNDSLFCNVVAGKLAPLDEPDRRVCSHCQCPENGSGGIAGQCWGVNEFGEISASYVKDCLRAALERDSDGSPEGRDAQRLDGEAATARAEGIAQ